MGANAFLRTSLVFLVLGVSLGMYMGITHDFTFTPAHAHLVLVGGVIMFMSGMFYRVHSHLSKKAITAHYFLVTVGVLLFVPGLMGTVVNAPWAAPLIGVGSALVYASIVFFAVMVFVGTRPKPD